MFFRITMQSVISIALPPKITVKEDFQLIDGQEPDEYEVFNIDGIEAWQKTFLA